MPDFWRGSGFGLLERRDDGRLIVTDDFLRAYLLRPELAPVEESCASERALHASLLEIPRRPITPVHLVALKDDDARESWEVFARFRDHLLKHPTLEDAYLALFVDRNVLFPALLVDHLVHVILRGILDDTADALRARAAECLFRPQKVTLYEGAILLADEETVDSHAQSGGLTTGGFGSLGQLLAEAAAPVRRVELDVLGEANQQTYWARSDRYDTVLDVSFTRPGLDALCRVMEAWVRHLLGVDVSIQPLQTIRDERWAWHTGLDAEASALMNELWHGREVPEERMARLLSLFRLELRDISVARPSLAGRPVYMGMAMDGTGRLRLKPQNLLVNLPLTAVA